MVEDDAVPSSVSWQAVTLMRCAWPGLFDGGLRWVEAPADAALRPVHVVRRHGEVLLAYAAVLRVTLELDGEVLDVAGVASVVTSPPYRGEGHATAVLRRVADVGDAGGADVGVLFCDPGLVPFYAARGWVACPGGTTVGPTREPSEDVRMIRVVSARGRALEDRLRERPVQVAWTW